MFKCLPNNKQTTDKWNIPSKKTETVCELVPIKKCYPTSKKVQLNWEFGRVSINFYFDIAMHWWPFGHFIQRSTKKHQNYQNLKASVEKMQIMIFTHVCIDVMEPSCKDYEEIRYWIENKTILNFQTSNQVSGRGMLGNICEQRIGRMKMRSSQA